MHGVCVGPQVVALYDYAAQRSDELSLQCGDTIKVLHKDTANWWMGELASGKQGFFPANYVTGADGTVIVIHHSCTPATSVIGGGLCFV